LVWKCRRDHVVFSFFHHGVFSFFDHVVFSFFLVVAESFFATLQLGRMTSSSIGASSQGGTMNVVFSVATEMPKETILLRGRL
jgi:hypothetical protein